MYINCFFIPCINWCLVYFCYECLFVTSTGMFKNELITWMCCWLVFCCHFFQFSTLAIACLFAFVTRAGVFLERAIHAALFPFPFNFSNRYFGSRHVFRTSHTCVLPFHSQLFQLQFYIYFGSRVERVVWTDQARNFFNEMQFHHLNESNELTRHLNESNELTGLRTS